MPNSGIKPRQFGHLKRFGIQGKEIVIKGFGNLPKLIGVDVPLVEYLANGARVARQLLRQPNIAAPLPLQLGPNPFSDVWKFVHSVALCRASPSKSNHKESVDTFCITLHSGYFWTTNRMNKYKKPTPISVNFKRLILIRH